MHRIVSYFFLLFLLTLLVVPFSSYAQNDGIVIIDFPSTCDPQNPDCLNTPVDKNTTDIRNYILRLYQFALGAGGIVAVGMIVAGGIFISASSASGAIGKREEGKDMIINAIWGLVLLFGSYIILNTINPEIVALKNPGGDTYTLGQCADNEEKINQVAYDNLSQTAKSQARSITDGDATAYCIPKTTSNDDCGEFNQIRNEKAGETCDARMVIANRNITITTDSNYYDIDLFATKPKIEPGDKFWQYPYFIKDQGIATKQCLIYAYQHKSTDPEETPEVTMIGLRDSLALCSPRTQKISSSGSTSCDPNDVLPPGSLTDQSARQKLQDAGITITSTGNNCSNRCDASCTSLEGIPQSAITWLQKVKTTCQTNITVTGGTETGHQSHGLGKSIVDLSFNTKLANCLRTQTTNVGVQRVCTTRANEQYRVACEVDEAKNHLHVEFRN